MTRSGRKKILIVSDTHGYLDPNVAQLAGDCDMAVHAGDIVGAGVLDELRAVVSEVVAVRGNNDVPSKWDPAEHGRLAEIPDDAVIDLPGGALAVVHGHKVWDYRDRHGRLRRQFPAARAIVYGHSHHQVCDQEHDPWVLNPGASGRNRTFGGPGCLILHAAVDAWHVETFRFPADSKQAV